MKGDATGRQKNTQLQPSTMHIRMVDLNLFRVFDALMLHRSVREASQLLSVSPSAVSHALNRLRETIRDQLFIPGGSGMEPSRQAVELAVSVREGVESFAVAFAAK